MKKLTHLFTLFALLLLVHVTVASAQTAGKQHHYPNKKLHSGQLIVVLTNGWDNLQGKLFAFSRRRHHWVLQFSNAVVVGSKGLGIGDGLEPISVQNAPVKHEGDKRAPAGIFSIGTVFGYADKQDAAWIKNPYVRAIDTLICVDDMRSASYNKLVAKDTAKTDYNSFEYMHRHDNYYKWGLFVNHNSGKVTPGDGSCIFMHIWENDHEGTDGCTAMAEASVLRILHWINAKDKPLLVQLPGDEYKKLRKGYGLPLIAFK